MSLFDVLKNADFGSVVDMIANQARGGMQTMQQSPGSLGGLLGVGAAAVLGNVMNSDLMKGVAMAGAGAVAWNFYKKWAANQDAQAAREEATANSQPSGWQNQEASLPSSNTFGRQEAADPTVELILRSMIYAAKADGNMDAVEQQRIKEVLTNLLPGSNVGSMVAEISAETVDPAKVAQLVKSADQAQDVYRLSCAIIDIDQFMERNYLDALAKSLNISQNEQKSLETEADMARKQLVASLPRN